MNSFRKSFLPHFYGKQSLRKSSKQILQLIGNYDVILALKRVKFLEFRQSCAGFRFRRNPISYIKKWNFEKITFDCDVIITLINPLMTLTMG